MLTGQTRPMHFDESLITELRAVAHLLHDDKARYVQRLEVLAGAFAGKESALENIIYDLEKRRCAWKR